MIVACVLPRPANAYNNARIAVLKLGLFGKLNNGGYGLLIILRIMGTFHAMRRWGEGGMVVSYLGSCAAHT